MPEPDERTRPTTVRWQVFTLASAASFLLYLHRYTWNVVGPKLQDEFHFNNWESGILFSLFYYTYSLGQIPSGVIVDRFGPHAALSLMILVWSGAIAAIGQSANLPSLGGCRLFFGAAQAGCYPALTKVTRNWFPPGRRTTVQGWVATTFGRAGGALSPIILGTVLMGWCGLSWRTSLGILGVFGVVYAGVFWTLYRNQPADHPGVNQAERDLIASGSENSALVTHRPLSAKRAWRSRSLRFFVVQQFLDAGSDVAFVSLIGTYFLRSHGFDIGKTGWLASLPLWGGAIGGVVGGWLNDRGIAWTGSRRWSRSTVGFVGKILGCAMLALMIQQSDGVTAAWILMAAKFFSDWSQPTTWGTCTDLGGRYSATVFSIVNTAGTLGGIVMPLVFGQVLDQFTTLAKVADKSVATTDWAPLFILLAAMYLASGVCWLCVDCTQNLDDQPETA